MRKESIIDALVSKGYQVKEMVNFKNGVQLTGIVIGTDTVRPTIYVDDFLNRSDSELDKVVEEIILIYEQSMKNADEIKNRIHSLADWDSVKENLLLCVQKKGNQNIVKREFLDLEQYVRVIVIFGEEEEGTFIVNPEHLEKYGITEEILFNTAWENTREMTEIMDMRQVIEEMGLPFPETEKTMIVASNKFKIYGASVILDTEKLAEVAERYESNLLIIPSSIHECILIPQDETIDKEYINEMIRDVNSSQLSPTEVLSDHAYLFDRNTKQVTCLTT